MVSYQVEQYTAKDAGGNNLHYVEGTCLSTDEKPTTGIFNGSKLMEMDTGKLFMFDAESSTWLEWGA